MAYYLLTAVCILQHGSVFLSADDLRQHSNDDVDGDDNVNGGWLRFFSGSPCALPYQMSACSSVS